MVTAVISSGISRVKSTRGFSSGKFSRMGRNFEIAALLMAAALLTAAALWGCSGSASAHPAEAQDELALESNAAFVETSPAIAENLNVIQDTGSGFTPTESRQLVIRDLQTYSDYDFVIYDGPGDFETVEILKADEVVYVYEGYKLYLSSFGDICRADSLTAAGMDITGDGIGNLVISEWTGGLEGCYLSHIFELGNCLRKIAVIDGVHEWPMFVDLNNDSSLEVIVRDWAFRGSELLGADEYVPEVILGYRDGAYEVELDLMFKPVHEADQLMLSAADLRNNMNWLLGEAPTRAICKRMLEMIYSGNAGLAWEYCRTAWHPAAPGRKDFLVELCIQLGESKYLEEIDELNHGRVLCPEWDDR